MSHTLNRLSTNTRPSNKLSKSHRHTSLPAYDDDLQRAIRESLKDNQQASTSLTSEPPIFDHSHSRRTEDDDPDLRAAIEASLRESQTPRASAPVFAEERVPYHRPYSAPTVETELPRRPNFTLPDYDLDVHEMDDVLKFSQAVTDAESNGTFSGRHSNDVSQLLDKATRVRPKMALSLDDTDRKQRENALIFKDSF